MRCVSSSLNSRMSRTPSPALLAYGQLCLLAMVAMGPDCWYRAEFCSVETGAVPGTGVTASTLGEQIEECYQQCYEDPTCMEFTLLSGDKEPKCFLFEQPCERIVDEPCIAQRCCVSGPKDCTQSTVSVCPTLVSGGSNFLSWRCMDDLGDIFDPYAAPVPAGSVCHIS